MDSSIHEIKFLNKYKKILNGMIVTYYNSFIVSQLDDNISKGPNVWYEVIMVNIYFLKIFEKE